MPVRQEPQSRGVTSLVTFLETLHPPNIAPARQ